MDITNILKLLDAGFTKDDILKIAGKDLLGGPDPEQKPKHASDNGEKPKHASDNGEKPKQASDTGEKPKQTSDIGEKLDKLIALTLASNFGAENPFNPNASEKAATDFFANIIAPEQGKEGAN